MYHSIFIYSGSLFHTGSYHNTVHNCQC